MSTLTQFEPAKTAFSKIFNRLCVALREKDTDAATLRVYYDALKDVPLEAVSAGADALKKEPGRKWFPTTGEWRHAADVALKEQLRHAIPAARREPWTHECDGCEDTGWVLGLDCSGTVEAATCGRPRLHAPHSWTKPCVCRSTNRTYRRHQMVGGGA